MGTVFFITEQYRYAASGNWEYKMVSKETDENVARSKFHARCAAVMKESNDFAMVIMYDNWGNRILWDVYDATDKPQPEIEEQ